MCMYSAVRVCTVLYVYVQYCTCMYCTVHTHAVHRFPCLPAADPRCCQGRLLPRITPPYPLALGPAAVYQHPFLCWRPMPTLLTTLHLAPSFPIWTGFHINADFPISIQSGSIVFICLSPLAENIGNFTHAFVISQCTEFASVFIFLVVQFPICLSALERLNFNSLFSLVDCDVFSVSQPMTFPGSPEPIIRERVFAFCFFFCLFLSFVKFELVLCFTRLSASNLGPTSPHVHRGCPAQADPSLFSPSKAAAQAEL